MRGLLGALALVGVLALFLAASAVAKPLSTADREFVDSTIESAMLQEGQPGVSISITGPAGDYSKSYGVKNKATGAPLTLADHFRTGSVTKTFTATAILQQVEKGKLSLNDKVSKWVSGIPNGNLITVRNLLAMRSGVYEYGSDPQFALAFGFHPEMAFTPQDAVEIMRKHPANFAPDEKYEYTNSNFVLLGLILEGVTGESAEDALRHQLIEPLGLEETTFPTTPAIPAPFSRGYCYGPALQDCTGLNPTVFWTAGALVTTVGDLNKYGRALGSGELLGPAMLAERSKFTGVQYLYGGPSEFGYGLGIISFGNWLGHDGSVPGFGSETFYEPQTGAVIAGMETLQTPKLSIFSRIFEQIGDHLYPGSMATPKY